MTWRGGDQRTSRLPVWTTDAGSVLVAVVIGGVATDAADMTPGGSAEFELLVGFAAALALWWRRRAPLLVAAVTFVAAAVAPFAAGAAIVSVFAVAVHRPTRVAAIVAALYLVPHGLTLLVRPGRQIEVTDNLLGAVLFTAGALGWGVAIRVREQAAGARATQVERDQQARIVEARRAERRRIATEMHDVLGHRLSLLSLHAGAIELRPGMPTEDLSRSASLVRRNAHLALEDLRAVIGVLREDAPLTLAPSPTAPDIETLIAEARSAGMPIDRSDVAVDLTAVPAELGRHLYRIVQEGLTNARKHAPGHAVALHLTGSPGAELQVAITNTSSPGPSAEVGDGVGVGLVGLRERATSIGGTLDHHTDEAGVHRLCVRLPWPA